MSLDLDKSEIYANPYTTNWNYLDNMTALQMKALNEMECDEEYKYILTDLWAVPVAWPIKTNAKITIKGFMKRLNEKIMEL
jgi:hypothetical protein